ncbi:MAG: tetratricopeptide repeat protein, partial [Gemmatimonadetes bacterium]|nr:tetratricopeptide repeat protein [Gemmatimonadota bacterium]NIU32834.1 tetratricopeptide repeat protein [Gemmatimonadota bacterium]NIU37254.1 tetratricopeptide repeat protein [Gemmatimonadota bacterium]NIV84188.1 tetratricopeptide repeat protein [Gemmatimonadota bacterium]NIW65918.1 tetratricopeptide repeat protein [Gemmatimonadota bacterium]
EALGPLVEEGDSTALELRSRLLVNAGYDAYGAGEEERARNHWEEALSLAPDARTAARNLAQLLLQAREPDSARAVASRALRHYPADDRLLYLRAMTLEGEEGLEEAIEATRRLYESSAEDEALGLQLAGLLEMAGERGDAGEIYRGLLEDADPSEEVFVAVADFWLGGQLYERTADVLTQALDRYPRSGRIWALLGEAEAGREAWDGAAAAYLQAAVLLDEPGEAELALTDVYLAAGDTASATAVLRRMDPSARGRAVLLRAARKSEELALPDLARAVYDALLERNPEDLMALEGAGRATEAAGDTAAALHLYRRAMARDSVGPEPALGLLRLGAPDPDSARILLGAAAWRGIERLGRYELGVAASIRGPADARRLARARPAIERTAELRRTVETVLDTLVFETDWGPSELHRLRRAFPDTRILETYATRLAARQGRDSVALARSRALLRRHPEAVDLHRLRARLLQRTEGPEAALSAWRQALDLEPEDGTIFRESLEAHRAAGRLEELLVQIERLRIIDDESRVLAEFHIELLHRMGRLEEAAEVARDLREPQGEEDASQPGGGAS